MFHLWWKEYLVKHQKVSKYYQTDCRLIQPFILLRSVKWVPGISGKLVAKSKLPPRSGSSFETELHLIHQKEPWSLFVCFVFLSRKSYFHYFCAIIHLEMLVWLIFSFHREIECYSQSYSDWIVVICWPILIMEMVSSI